MTIEELKHIVDEIIQRTRNQDMVAYADVETLINYIDLMEYQLIRYERMIDANQEFKRD